MQLLLISLTIIAIAWCLARWIAARIDRARLIQFDNQTAANRSIQRGE